MYGDRLRVRLASVKGMCCDRWRVELNGCGCAVTGGG